MKQNSFTPTKLIQNRHLEIATSNDLAPWDTQPGEFDEEWALSNNILSYNPSQTLRTKLLSSPFESYPIKSDRTISHTRYGSIASKPREKLSTFSGKRNSSSLMTRVQLDKSAQAGNNLAGAESKNLEHSQTPVRIKAAERDLELPAPKVLRRQLSQAETGTPPIDKILPKLELKTSQSVTNLHQSSETVKVPNSNQSSYIPDNLLGGPKLSNSHIRQKMNTTSQPNLFFKPHLLSGIQFILAPHDSIFPESSAHSKPLGDRSGVPVNFFGTHRRKVNENQMISNRRTTNSESSPGKDKSPGLSSLTSLSSFTNEFAIKTLKEIKNSTSREFKDKGDVYSKIQVEKLVNKALSSNLPASKLSFDSAEKEKNQLQTPQPKIRINLRTLLASPKSPRHSQTSRAIVHSHRTNKASNDSIKVELPSSIEFNAKASASKERAVAVEERRKEFNDQKEFSDAAFTLPYHQQQQIVARHKFFVNQPSSSKFTRSSGNRVIPGVKIRNLFSSVQNDAIKKSTDNNPSQNKLLKLLK